MKKNIFALFAAAIILLTNAFAADILHVLKTEIPIARGAVYKQIRHLTPGGWQNINVVEADLNDPTISFQLLYSGNKASIRESVKNIVNQGGAIAGVNAEFFSFSAGAKISNGGYGVGFDANNGEIISLPSTTETLASFVIEKNGNVLLDYFKHYSKLTFEDGAVYEVKHLNQVENTAHELVVYTARWNEYSRGTENNGIYEIVVENNEVKELRINNPPVKIPENGFVISGYINERRDFFDYVKPGFKVDFSIQLTPEVDPQIAVGGGTLLLKEGKATPFVPNISGYHPRSGLGIDQSGKKLFFVSVDGRGAGGSIGMTLEEFKWVFIELGAYSAINLDGGGSTQMAVKQIGQNEASTVNVPSESPYRKVINAAGVVLDGEKDVLAGIIVNSKNNILLKNCPEELEITPYDELGNVLNFDASLFSVTSDKGYADGIVFHPEEEGKTTLLAKYGDVTFELKREIMSEPVMLKGAKSYYALSKGEYTWITVEAVNKDGYTQVINPTYINSGTAGNAVTLLPWQIYAGEAGTDIIEVSLGECSARIPVFVDFAPDYALRDTYNKYFFETLDASAVSYPASVKSSYEISSDFKTEGNNSGKLSYDFSAKKSEIQSAAVKFKNPIKITEEKSVISIDVHAKSTNNQWLRAIITDSNNKEHRVTIKEKLDFDGFKTLDFQVPGNVFLPANISQIYIVQPNSDTLSKGEIYLDNLQISTPLIKDKKLADYKNKAEENSKFSFTAGVYNPNKLIDLIVLGKTESKMAESIRSLSFLGRGMAITPPLSNNLPLYGEEKITKAENVKVIQLDNLYEKLANVAAVWHRFSDETANANEKTVIIVMKDYYAFADKDEERAFNETIKNNLIDRGIVPYIVAKGSKTEVSINNGIRLISLATADTSIKADMKANADVLHIYPGTGNYCIE